MPLRPQGFEDSTQIGARIYFASRFVSVRGMGSKLSARIAGDLRHAVIIGCALSFGPAVILVNNREHFDLTALELVSLYGLLFLISILAIGILRKLPFSEITRGFWYSSVLAISLISALFIPSGFQVVDFAQIDGIQSRENAELIWGSIAIAVIAGFFVSRLDSVSTLANGFKLLTGFLLLYGITTILTSLFYSNQESLFSGEQERHSQSLNSDQNIFLISFDQIQNEIMRSVIQSNPDFEQSLTGFTFFENAITPYPNTSFSLASAHLGRLPENESETYEWALSAEASLSSELESKGFSVAVNQTGGETKSINKIQLVELLRHGLNRSLGFVPPIEGLLFDETETLHGRDLAWKDDIALASSWVGGFVLGEEVPKAVFHHFFGTHQPFSVTDECKVLGKEEMTIQQTEEGAYSSAKCAARIISEFIQRLKDLGVYENSTIVLFSDHGYEKNINDQLSQREQTSDTGGRSNIKPLGSYLPFLMIKQPSSASPLAFSKYPASLIDIAPTICSQVGCNNSNFEGVDLFEAKNLAEEPLERRHREFYLFKGALEEPMVYHGTLDPTIWERRGFKGGLAEFQIAMRNYPKIDWGDELTFGVSGSGSQILGRGWSGAEAGFVWSDGESSEVLLQPPVVHSSATCLDLEVKYSLFLPPGEEEQTVRVTVEEHHSQILVLRSSESVAKIRINAKDVTNPNLRLVLEWGRTYKPCEHIESADCRDLAFAISGLKLKSAE